MSGAHRAQTPRQSRKNRRTSSAKRPSRSAGTDAHRAQNAATEPQMRMRTKRKRPSRAARAGAHRAQNAATEPRMETRQAQPPRQSRRCGHTPSAEHPDSPNQPAAACPHSEFRIPPAVPPRAQSPVPALKPASTVAAPAHNSLSCEAEYRFFASARSDVCGRKARRSYSYAEQETP